MESISIVQDRWRMGDFQGLLGDPEFISKES